MIQALFPDGLEDICAVPDPAVVRATVIRNWQEVLFSDAPDHSLRRYFTCSWRVSRKSGIPFPRLGITVLLSWKN